jgi:DNA (cytosine-5)-methyltransferase 1
MNVLELNAGAGGFALGMERAGLPISWAIDFDEDACASYQKLVGRAPLRIDLREFLRLLQTGIVRSDIDLVIADPPCTPWSRAGSRKGLADERDTLAVSFEIVKLLQPKAFLLGNIPGLEDGPNRGYLHKVMAPLYSAYCIDFRVLDAADYGTPQHRSRPFWFGHRPLDPHIRWPSPTHGPREQRQLGIAEAGQLVPFVSCREALAGLTDKELGKPVALRKRSCNGKQHGSVADKPARVVGTSNLSDGNVLLLNDKHPISTADQPSRTITAKGDGRGAQGGCVLEWPWDRPATTVHADPRLFPSGHKPESGARAAINDRAIRLSELAAAILQGFPYGTTFAGRTKKSRWSQIGQALPPQVGEALGSALRRWDDESRAHAMRRSLLALDREGGLE